MNTVPSSSPLRVFLTLSICVTMLAALTKSFPAPSQVSDPVNNSSETKVHPRRSNLPLLNDEGATDHRQSREENRRERTDDPI